MTREVFRRTRAVLLAPKGRASRRRRIVSADIDGRDSYYSRQKRNVLQKSRDIMTEQFQPTNLFNDPNRDQRPYLQTNAPLPMTVEEVKSRNWDEVDVVFITGDAYVDSPSFANGLLARLLERDGFRVAVLSQPAWDSPDDFRKFGRPRLAFCVSAGNMDSMINHYTANRKVRNDDAYSPGGKIGRRPDRATLAYCQRAREAFPGVPIIAGGVEASLRRIAHYDYWSEKVKRSIIFDAKCDLLVYGMGERPMLEIMRRLNQGESIRSIRDVRGVAYKLGRKEDLPEESDSVVHLPSYEEVEESRDPVQLAKLAKQKEDPELAKEAQEAKKSRSFFVKMTKIVFANLNPYSAKTLVQEHGDEAVVVNPPSFPLSTEEMDAVYALPFTRKAHPSYTEPIPAVEIVRSSVLTHRGCFGGCSFCAIAAHQGKFIQSRSADSILTEIKTLADESNGSFTVGDLNAPTANMYAMGGNDEDICKKCARVSCLCPSICRNLNTDHLPYIKLLRAARSVSNVKQVLIASGIRTDLANRSPEFVEELAAHHTGGHLKTAPEHVDDYVLRLMNKPPISDYENFCQLFIDASRRTGKEQYLVPYLISGFPGCTLESMVGVAEYLKQHNIRPEQVQDFIPAPFQLATCAYYTGIDPITDEEIYVPRGQKERALQRALLLYYNPAFYHEVKSALKQAGREDLIGTGENCLIPPYTSRESALRRSSQVKRFVKQSERERMEREESERRSHEDGARKRSFGGKREGREHYSAGGYRSGARSFGSGQIQSGSRVWDPIDKHWKRDDAEGVSTENGDSSSRRDRGTRSFSDSSTTKGKRTYAGKRYDANEGGYRKSSRSNRKEENSFDRNRSERRFGRESVDSERYSKSEYRGERKNRDSEKSRSRNARPSYSRTNDYDNPQDSKTKKNQFHPKGDSQRQGEKRFKGNDRKGNFKKRNG